MLVSPHRRAIITEFNPPQANRLSDQLAAFPSDNLDLILVEGFRDEAIAKIELHRPSLGKPLLYPNDPHIIAVASDQLINPPANLPCLDLNQPQAIADFILDYLDGHPA
jgi:molybdopterin-guanine dinucleotide biosynthesis protein B